MRTPGTRVADRVTDARNLRAGVGGSVTAVRTPVASPARPVRKARDSGRAGRNGARRGRCPSGARRPALRPRGRPTRWRGGARVGGHRAPRSWRDGPRRCKQRRRSNHDGGFFSGGRWSLPRRRRTCWASAEAFPHAPPIASKRLEASWYICRSHLFTRAVWFFSLAFMNSWAVFASLNDSTVGPKVPIQYSGLIPFPFRLPWCFRTQSNGSSDTANRSAKFA